MTLKSPFLIEWTIPARFYLRLPKTRKRITIVEHSYRIYGIWNRQETIIIWKDVIISVQNSASWLHKCLEICNNEISFRDLLSSDSEIVKSIHMIANEIVYQIRSSLVYKGQCTLNLTVQGISSRVTMTTRAWKRAETIWNDMLVSLQGSYTYIQQHVNRRYKRPFLAHKVQLLKHWEQLSL